MELVRFPSRGGFSVRSILTFAFAVLITALFWATSGSLSAHAATDAHWGGDAIIYNDHGFTEATDVKDTTGTIPDGSKTYKTPVLTTGSGSSASQKVFIIYFTPGVDPPTATSAKYVEFDYNNGTLSNPQNQKDISLTDKSHQTNNSSCAIDGVGWMVCPVSNFLANAMDHIFSWLAQLIETQPPTLGDTGSSMYTAWNIMRTIANVAFVIVFLIIIYSQLTGLGVSNYGLKKLIPRLIVAAILVNISFYIAALAIDVSNILGFSIQEIFVTIRKGVFHITDENAGVLAAGNNAWGTVTTVVLGAGGVVGGAYYAASGGIYLLMPLLIGLLLTIMLVFLILAARQAIILCLVIIAPLAFVANLLPNTEKWFDKWKDLFMTMLIFFPAFSLVFGASQLAGQIIIQNASSQGSVNNIVMLIFGLAVQVAPLVITPLLLKFSGGLLGRIAQIANNPRKGVIDRNRNWAQARAEHAKQRNIKLGPRLRNPASWGAGMVGRNDRLKRRLADSTDIWKKGAENRYKESKQYSGLHERRMEFDETGKAIHDEHDAHAEALKTRQGTPLYTASMRATVAKEHLEANQQHTAGYYNTLRTVEGTPLNASSLNLETAKTNAQASEQNAAAYLNERRTFRTTQLGMAAERLEAAKLNAEGWQNRYTAHIDSLKVENAAGVIPNASIANAAIFAQSGKEHAEAAQARVQAMFDRDRVTDGTALNISSVNLEGAKLAAETAQSITTRYMNEQKATVGTELHLDKIRAEEAKLAAQVSETALNRTIEEYKSGKLVRTGELSELMVNMVDNVARQSAEARGIQAAQNIQQKNNAEALVDTTPMGENLIRTAASVDPNGAIRARAAALSQLARIEKEALDNNIILIDEQADHAGVNSIEWSRGIFQRHIGQEPNPDYDSNDPNSNEFLPAERQDPAILEAALQKLAQDGDVGSIRKALITKLNGDGDEYKPILNRVIARTADTLKAKGGFDIQQKVSKLWGVSQAEMDVSVAGSLGAITADNVAGQKWGWWNSYVKEDANGKTALERIIENSQPLPTDTEQQAKDKAFARKMLQSFYGNLTTALTSQEIMTKIGDRKTDTARMHKILHLAPDLIDHKVILDYSLTEAGIANPIPDLPKPQVDNQTSS